jgi:hypothetical protein
MVLTVLRLQTTRRSEPKMKQLVKRSCLERHSCLSVLQRLSFSDHNCLSVSIRQNNRQISSSTMVNEPFHPVPKHQVTMCVLDPRFAELDCQDDGAPFTVHLQRPVQMFEFA